MKNNRVPHLFQIGSQSYVYVPWTKTFSAVSKHLARDFGKNPTLLHLLSKNDTKAAQIPAKDNQRIAATVYLNMSSGCNLKCIYCYAERGKYQETRASMTVETVKAMTKWFASNEISIGHVTMFGGEPLLRFNFIKETVDILNRQAHSQKQPIPTYSTITNGTYLDDEKIHFFKLNKFSLTISIDGPKDIHNFLRPGAGSNDQFSTIEQNLRNLVNSGVIPNIEVTYTKHHMKNNVSPKDILMFLRNYGIKNVIVSPAGGQKEDEWKVEGDEVSSLFAEAAEFSMESLITDRPILMQNVLMILKNIYGKHFRESHQFCYALLGENHFAVSASGGVYPCQMFNDQKEFYMGNVHQNHRDDFGKTQEKLKANSRELNQCQKCWAKEICFICPGGVYLETDQIKEIPKHRCHLVKRMSEQVIAYMARLAKDRKRKDRFWFNLQQSLS